MKARKLPKKKYKVKENGFTKYSHEIFGILLLALGIISLLSFYYRNSVGVFGEYLKELLLGIFGLPAFIIPPVIIAYAIFMIFRKDSAKFNIRILYAFILLILASSLIHTGYYDPEKYENLNTIQCISKFFREGIELSGGGVFGGIISAPFIGAFRVLGAVIIITALSIVDIILLTNVSIANFIRNLKDFFFTLFKKPAKVKKVEKTSIDEIGFEPDVIGDDEDLSLEFKSKPKVIDFKIEKASKELKEKAKQALRKKEKIEEPNFENVDFIINDLSKSSEQVKIFDPNATKQTARKKDAIDEFKLEPVKEHTNTEYRFPGFELLEENTEYGKNIKNYKNAAIETARKLEETLASFGVDAKVINISRGPAVTRYELQPSPGVKVSKIVNLSDDIALNLAASGVRIEAPIPGKAAIGIEVPNREVTPVQLREVIESPDFMQHSSKLAFAVGKDISGENVVSDIAKMPHLLIAGATGSGKSVCINSLIVSILYKASPDEVKLLMIDPKVVELGIYNGIPHLLIPVVTEPKKAAGALNWAVQEMVNRYKLFAEKGVRDIKGYNTFMKDSVSQELLPQVVIIIDELADLMMVAPNDVEDAVCRLAQMARAAGMHLVIATQRPSVDVITGVIKANIPSRISFAVSSQVDSRTILDMAGAEKLLGKGDMLYYPVGEPKPIRVKGAFVSDKEVEKVVEFIKSQGNAEYNNDIIDEINSENEPAQNDPGDNDELLPQAIELVVDAGQASVSLIQRKFKVGYARAARIVDQMEERGIVGAFEGSKPRQVLISRQQWQEMQMTNEH